jgi:hypothetical protein
MGPTIQMFEDTEDKFEQKVVDVEISIRWPLRGRIFNLGIFPARTFRAIKGN